MLRRNKHTGLRPRIEGRPRLLDDEKKVELCEHVAKGASVEDAAETSASRYGPSSASASSTRILTTSCSSPSARRPIP